MQIDYKFKFPPMLIPYFEKDERFFFLLGDTGFGISEEFMKKFPKRIINAGIAEQSTVGIAAGMALSGMIPVVYSMCNFLAFRALEQIRNDVVLQNANVKLIGVGANNYFEFLGESHTCADDDASIMRKIGMKVYDPYLMVHEVSFPIILDDFMLSSNAGYLRL